MIPSLTPSSFPKAVGRSKVRGKKRRVVISGIGIVSPIGVGREEFWRNLLSQKCGIDWITSIDSSSFPCRIAAEIKNFEPSDYLSRRQIEYYSRSTQFAYVAAQLAVRDAAIKSFDPYRTDVIIGAGSSDFEFVDKQVSNSPSAGRQYSEGAFDQRGIPRFNINSPACAISYLIQSLGYVSTVATACASGLSAIGLSCDRLRNGLCDITLSGAADCPINYFVLNLFCAAGFLSTDVLDPGNALCPFDRRRTRSVLGEASCILVLEELEHALARSAPIYAEILEFEQRYENVNEFFITDRMGDSWAQTIKATLSARKGRIGYINAHATSDSTLDAVESRALHGAFGAAAGSIPTSSIKGSTGSPFGAAGALQVAVGALVLKNKTIPASYNYREPDPECNVQVTTHNIPLGDTKNVLVSGHGFGGVDVSVVLGEPRL